MKKIPFLWLGFLTLIGFLLRVWNIGSLPEILNRDEAALGYNAYLLMETGKDEWGRAWPLGLESFGDYKLPGYPTLLIPFLRVFGLHDWVVRIPSALAGTALIPLVYFLALRFSLKKNAPLVAALFIAISPVFIWYSRFAYEANVALTLVVAALLLLLRFRDHFSWMRLIACCGLCTVAVLTYNTPLLLLPVFALIPLFFVHQNMSRRMTVSLALLIVTIIGAWLLLPISAQKSGITIFTDETVYSHWVAFRSSLPETWQPFLGSRYVYWAGTITANFAKSFSPTFLVMKGGSHPWHTVPGAGHVLGGAYVLAGVGLLASIRTIFSAGQKKDDRYSSLMLILVLCASLLPSIVTVDAPHATRSLLFFVFFTLLAAKGLYYSTTVWLSASKTWFQWIFICGLLIQGVKFSYQLFAEFPNRQSAYQPGFNTLVQEIEKDYPETPVAIVDPAGYHYILLAWYLRMPANEYFSTVSRQLPDHIGFRYGERVTHYHFIADPLDRSEDEVILIQWISGEARWSTERL